MALSSRLFAYHKENGGGCFIAEMSLLEHEADFKIADDNGRLLDLCIESAVTGSIAVFTLSKIEKDDDGDVCAFIYKNAEHNLEARILND